MTPEPSPQAPERRRILIIARRDAREVDGVIDGLRNLGLSITRWNLCQFPEHERVTIRGGGSPPCTGIFDSDFAAAWLHDAGGISVFGSLEGIPREISIRECSAFWEGALLRLSTNWLNYPTAIRTASNKILQLTTAERLGIRIPPFAVTNDPRVVSAFLHEYGTLVIKNLATGYIEHPTTRLKFYTRKMNEVFPGFDDTLRYGPVIVQQEIAKTREIRVTVVDQCCFSVSIDCADLDDSKTDVRRLDFNQDRWRFRADRSLIIEAESRRIVEALGLSYAGLDWVIDGSGQAYFLECNPLGSFKWYELVSGESITNALVDALARRCVLA